jgi:hypothetical protein
MQRHRIIQKCPLVVVAARVGLETAMQRLVNVAHEVNDKFQRVILFRAGFVQLGRVVQNGTVQAKVVWTVRRLQDTNDFDKH